MRRRAGVERCVEIFAECGAKRCLIAAIDRDLLEHSREKIAGHGVENLGERARLGFDAGEFAARFLQGRTRSTFGRARLGHRLLSGVRSSLGGFQPRLRLLGKQLLLRRIGKPGDPLGDLGRLAVDSRKLPLEPVASLGRLAQRALDLVARGGRLGPFGRQLRKCCFAQASEQPKRPAKAPRVDVSRSSDEAFSSFSAASSAVEPLQHVGVVADHLLLARDVGVELFEAAGEFRAAALDARRLFLDLRLGDGQPLEGRGGRGFGLAQFRQAMGADRLFLGGFHLGAGALADD